MQNIKNNIVDRDIINEAQHIMGEDFKSLLQQFIVNANDALTTIELSRASNDLQSVCDVVHTMKSSAFQMGAMQVHDQSAHIEQFLNNQPRMNTIKNEMALDGMIDDLRQALDLYQKTIVTYL